MLGLKKKDSNKEIELIATMADFNQEFTKIIAPPLKPVYTLIDTQTSVTKKSKVLKELIDFNIYAYKNYVNRKLYSTCLKWRREMRDSLYISIQTEKAFLDGTARSDPYKIKQLIDSKKGLYTLSSKVIEKQTKKAVLHYTVQHGHGLPRDILTFSARQHIGKSNKAN